MGWQRVGHDWVTKRNWTEYPSQRFIGKVQRETLCTLIPFFFESGYLGSMLLGCLKHAILLPFLWERAVAANDLILPLDLLLNQRPSSLKWISKATKRPNRPHLPWWTPTRRCGAISLRKLPHIWPWAGSLSSSLGPSQDQVGGFGNISQKIQLR